MLDQKTLKELLHYNPDTGVFTWKKRPNARPQWNTRYAGKVAGCFSCGSYVTIGLKNKSYMAHRLAWLYVYGYIPKEIDHKDLDKSNNSIKNLRKCTRSKNKGNVGVTPLNTSGYKGVYKRRGRFCARIRNGNKRVYLGDFKEPKDAAKAYDKAAKSIFGEFALTNKMLGLL